MKIVKWVAGIVLLLVLSIGGFIAYKLYEYRPDPACFARDVVLVNMNGTYLAVPRAYRPVFHATEGHTIPYADKLTMLWVCQRENDPPLEVKSIWVTPEPLQENGLLILAVTEPAQFFLGVNEVKGSDTERYKRYKFIYETNIAVDFRANQKDSAQQIKNNILNELKKWHIAANAILGDN